MGNENSKSMTELPQEKHQNGHAVTVLSNNLENSVTCETVVEQSSSPPSLLPSAEPGTVESDSSGPRPEVVKQEPVIKTVAEAEPETQNAETPTTPDPEPDPQEKEPKRKEKVNIFDKLRKKKAKPQATADPDPKIEETVEETVKETVEESCLQMQTVPEKLINGIRTEPQAEVKKNPEEKPTNPSLEAEEVKSLDIGKESVQLQEDQEESKDSESEAENISVMNFFKILMTPTKKKQETVPPDVKTEQSQKEVQSPASSTVAQVADAPATAKGGMSFPPPPPPAPAPPKMEVKAQVSVQPVTNTPKEEPKGAATVSDATKPKASRTFSKLFSKKTLQPEEPEPEPEPVVEVQVDASKTATLEASAKPEVPPPAPDEKKKPSAAKPSAFSSFSLFKPKDLLNQMASKVQTASSSGVRLLKKPFKGAANPKKEASAPVAEVVAGPSVAKEEPKISEAPAVSASPEGGENSPVLSKRLEKRNSINLFFKNLGKRQSDAGVQTEPEKTK
ncbi:hypothetical protein UPYG_G00002230 [Umbra pygmaea]|uniref:Uncharacterized protein n=1 Tax=Umbra pygmaea TaxID=75934 RepID=A0ABD0XGN1_UMBPY